MRPIRCAEVRSRSGTPAKRNEVDAALRVAAGRMAKEAEKPYIRDKGSTSIINAVALHFR
jgi:hypothetical protein